DKSFGEVLYEGGRDMSDKIDFIVTWVDGNDPELTISGYKLSVFCIHMLLPSLWFIVWIWSWFIWQSSVSRKQE
ncbi:MAG: Stealth CR1 domain-containing protein, partial [Clostridiales bacterium]|nr:Stealth CR1 domain-containing protein [Clostridiales bacterium]